ncbi:subtype I-F CRISPR-associated endonuclease Cas1 [bacterium (Candidatus Blackallbacteria) CG17_big_fil_post_rev_8_21_14_2_50_48_46]|uniref:CRISPR-associated endonuclease Cas1 n=1 Tax=bacterium (Candidatus Blackallbacteria) CG17_big_fil_post_rev_8_21_14_2_50_48_46 TaxID=2014261 RepID=A0A2M7G8V9_9BACT|nr:MAG: subtype I-F CRISPR-associated endonuclease Cas1 [bacterium (Candidatus Blackallbacteria) CG18_big_fil_WC_8_21_14_2_50_49_26]PIW18552.1 MAG: subtype I-F CRISPR-associated endonuclease Cas1 [bacterium (Candidatus Blackallbacteria) CG17_big_fil_post_rev_8_21_14_2_50_48_46]PIW46463.1 MAG: subtype I-F CRISPR-associated endonuclease Cas1 [bacterium (Candidatus Blackallbacteria) CG13_big_fil_rev_8_21_14_2_50_49_14]
MKNLFGEQRELKAILTSKRANLFYLEHCRVMVKGGKVVFLTENSEEKQYWNIPIANTSVVLLGTGTSITQAAVRLMASAGVMLGFSGSGGTPLISATEIEWLSPQSEYRPTEYMQAWMSFWFDEQKRLIAAQLFQRARCDFIENVWSKDRELQGYGFYLDDRDISSALSQFRKCIPDSVSTTELLQAEAQFTKALYKIAAKRTKYGGKFVRERYSEDGANSFLDHGNYLAYGLAATTLWVLGIPHGFAVMHGKTRRGALVFDVADLIKDTLILPWAFICAQENFKDQEFRQQCLEGFSKYQALDFLFEKVKSVAFAVGHSS